ncbi:hypothetical protein V7087_01355 [Neobacillus niacini]|uniref:hypothetical protein n=1 Tax=Neobacillus niacini TaxID=86668 RepID=UPI002FFD806A
MAKAAELEGYQGNEGILFTYHKESGYIGFVWAMVAVMVLETAGVSYLLYKWSPILHWIHLILSISVIVFLIVDLRAVIRNPIIIKNNELSLKIGIRSRVTIPTENIKELKSGSLYQEDRKNKEVFDLSLFSFDDPIFELVLDQPIEFKALFGQKRGITRIFFSVDNKAAFYNIINANLKL